MRSVWAIDEPSLVDWISKRREGADLVGAGAVGHAPQRILVAAAGAKLEHDRAELLGEQRMRRRHFHADPGEGRFEAKAGLDADQHQVERIGKAVDDLALAAVGLGADEQAGQIEAAAPRRSMREIELDARSGWSRSTTEERAPAAAGR